LHHNAVTPPSFLISGTHSGVGKTTVTFILISLLRQIGYQIQPFKHGPDFIDPGYHRLASGRDSINLDFWMMGKQQIIQTFNDYMQNADIGIVEAMGALFDGKNGTGEGSAAHLALTLSLPTILVVDVYGITRSVNALLQGFLDFDPHLKISGIIFNRAGSQKHYEMIFDSLLPRFRSLSLGYLPRFSHLNIPERHLGLLTIEENLQMTQISEAYLKTAKETLDLRPLATKFEPIGAVACRISSRLKPPPIIRLGVAKDKAFCFYYQQNLNFLEDAGAELVYFSPLEDTELPQDLDGLYLGGGFPENFAQQLAENDGMKFQILRSAQVGMPIYAECGGLIYVCAKLLFEDESAFSMVGIFPHTIKWDKNYLAIRYVEIQTTRDTILGPKGLLIKGQEFHQTRLLNDLEQQDCCYEVRSSTNEQFLEGLYTKNVLASYMHLYFPSEEKIANHFVFQCKKYQQEKHVYSNT
jgi:cobyrinic acid a,c-diamide synthase